MQLTRPSCDCRYLGSSFQAINSSITVNIGSRGLFIYPWYLLSSSSSRSEVLTFSLVDLAKRIFNAFDCDHVSCNRR